MSFRVIDIFRKKARENSQELTDEGFFSHFQCPGSVVGCQSALFPTSKKPAKKREQPKNPCHFSCKHLMMFDFLRLAAKGARNRNRKQYFSCSGNRSSCRPALKRPVQICLCKALHRLIYGPYRGGRIAKPDCLHCAINKN